MAKFWEFLAAVFSHWEPIMSGVLVPLLLLWLSRLYQKHYGSGALPWYVYVSISLIFLFYASYRAWLDKDILLTKATEDRPQFVIRLHGAVGHFDPAQSVTLMVISMRVVNRGTPSAITDYFINYQSPDMNQKGKLIQPSETLSIPLPDKQTLIVRPEDNIHTKGNTPIPRGGFTIGRLTFVVSGDRRKDLREKETKITITIKDSWEKEYSKELIGGGRQTLTYIPGDTIPPGTKGVGPDNQPDK